MDKTGRKRTLQHYPGTREKTWN